MIAAGGVIILSGIWLGATAMMARDQLNQARTEIHTLRTTLLAGNWKAARATATDLATHAHRANQLTSGPLWALGASLPEGGEPLRTVRGITASIDSVSQGTLPRLVRVAERLDPRILRRPDGSIDLARIATVRADLSTASTPVTHARRAIAELPAHTWLSAVDTSRREVLNQITELNGTLGSAKLAVQIVPTMLGTDGPKRYLLAFQNEAEARGTGGLAGAFALIEADHGTLKLRRIGSDVPFSGITADVDFGPEYRHLYDESLTTSLYGNANLSPHFPYAAQIWASMWQKYSGDRLDGVIAVDPTALSYLLAASGPAALPDQSLVSASNVVALTQSTAYARFGGLGADTQTRRRDYLLGIATAASSKILEAPDASEALLRAASKAAGERRVLVWSADPKLQADLAKTSVAGIIPVTKAPYIGLSIVNDGGNKLDYYLDRALTWRRTGCGPVRRTSVTVTLTNHAPASGLSPYVTGRSDRHSSSVKPGDNRLRVTYFATQGSRMDSVTVAGRPGTAAIGVERGHPVYTVDLELPRGTSRTVVLHLREPAAHGEPIVLRQPLVRPLHVTLHDAGCH